MIRKDSVRRISRFAISFFAIFSLTFAVAGCRAKAAPDSGFIKNPQQMQEVDSMPFNAFWPKEGLDWSKYSKIIIRPVDTTHMEKMSWWDKSNPATKLKSAKKEAKILADHFQKQLIKEYSEDPKKHFTVVDTAGPKTLILEMALVEVIPTKAGLNAAGYLLVGALDFGTTAMEGRFRDAETNQVIAKFKDAEHGQMALISVADLQWYAHAKHTVDHWSKKMVEVTNSKPGDKVAKNWTVTLRPW